MRRILLYLSVLVTLNLNAQEGTKQFMPNSNDRLWLEFSVFNGNDFGMYGCDEKERINIYLNAGETMYFGMKMNTLRYSGDVWTIEEYRSFRIKDESGNVVLPEQMMVVEGNNGYIADYTEAVTGPNGVTLNGSTITGGYVPLSYTATTSGNHYIEFESWWDTYGSSGNTVYRDRWALKFFDVTVTDASGNVITNPGEPNKSAGRLWSRGWSFTNTSFDDYPVNAHFYVFTSDEFINKVNFKMYPYSFAFVVNSYGVTTYTEKNYIKRTQSLEDDQTSGDDISEYRVFLNDPDRTVWSNTTLEPPKVQVWTEDTLYFDYDYNRNPLYLNLDHDQVFMEKNRDGCPYEDVTIFKIESNIDGFTAILIDIDKDGSYSTGGSDRVIYRDMKKGVNYVLWDFKTDAGAIVAEGSYNASATFLGRGPAHFPLYDVEQMDGIVTSSIRPFNKLNTTIYWDDTQISAWGDQDGGDLMDETQQKQLVIENEVPRTWSWHSDLSGSNHNGNMNTMNTWFNAVDLGYSSIGLEVQQSETKCIDGLAPWVGDIFLEGPKNTDIVFDTVSFNYKFFDPREYHMDSIQILSLPENGTLKLSAVIITVGQKIHFNNIENITFTPDADWFGRTSFEWTARNGDRWANNQENIYLTINTKPVISDIADQTLCTNTPTGDIPFTISDDENDLNSIEVTGFSADPNFVPNSGIVIGGSGANRTVSVTPVANKSGKAIIYLMADDGLSKSFEEFTVYVGPDLEFSGDTTICDGQDLYLIAQETGADSYRWDFDGSTVSAAQSVQQTAGSVDVGQWSLTIEKDGCISTRNFLVTVSPLTTFSGDVDVCVGQNLTLSATEVNANYAWYRGGTELATTKIFSIPSVALSDAGNDYTLYVDKDGCTNTSDPFTITVQNQPNTGLAVQGDTVDPGYDGTITISSAQNGITYNVYQNFTLVNSGVGTGSDLDISVAESYLSIGENEFIVKADNGNCEIDLSNTATVLVNTPGITLTAISGNTIEDGTTATFAVTLDTEPANDVIINLTSDDLSEGTVSPSSVTLTSVDYGSAHYVTVTGVDDNIIDGNITFSIITDAATSGDPNYNGLNADDVTVINEDDDIAEVIVTPTTGLNTTEAGDTDNFTIRLASQPEADVTINLSSSNEDEGTVSPTSVTFDSSNWDQEVTFTVTGVDDDVDDGNQTYYIITSLSSSVGDSNFDGLLVDDIEILNSDDDNAGITVNPTTGLTVTEVGGSDQFTIVLNSEPTDNVSIAISSADLSEGTVSTSNVTFTPLNWSEVQTITVTGVNDPVDDGDISFSVTTDAAVSTDAKYNGLNPANVTVTNTDDDNAGITVNPISGLTTTEGGGQATFTIRLNSQPTSDVTINLSSNNTDEGTISPTSILFDNSNWNSNQTITITGVDDNFDDGDITYTIVTAAAVSSDGNYNGLNESDISVTNIDNDNAGVTISPTSVGTTEGGGTGVFSVVLTSQPLNDVTISFSGIDATEGTIDKNSVTFSSVNWNTAQEVTVTGVGDESDDGNVSYTIITTAVSSDGTYDNIAVNDVTVTNADNDIAGITVSPTSGVSTTEAGGTTTFTIALNTQPSDDVTITLSSSNENEGTVSPTTVTFTNADWAAKTITLTGVDDNIDDGNIPYTIQTSNSSSSDIKYDNVSVDDVSVSNIDDDEAGITVNPTTSLITTEAGGTATFQIVLDSEPTADVTIGLSSDNENEGTVSPASVTFTNGNWSSPITITISGQDDDIDDGDILYNILTAAATSTDGNYGGLDAANVQISNTDDDTFGITVTPTSGLTTAESGTTATFDIVLNSEPTDNVVISVSSNNTAEGTVSPAGLTFTSGNWSTPQSVTITGVDDFVDDGDVSYTIVTGTASSSDVNYSGFDADDVNVTNIDDDTAGITVNPNSGLTTSEAGGTAVFTIKLDSRPTSTVTINLNSDNENEGTVLPASVIFNTTNWNTPVNVTITGVDDDIADGDINYTIITAAATSSDAKYNGIDASDVTVTNMDDDVAGVNLSATTGLETTESGGQDSFTISLNSEPTADVTITLSSSNEDEGTISTGLITFTAGDWSDARTVTLTGVDDDFDDGDMAYLVITGDASSTDTNYDGFVVPDINATNIDNDEAGITVQAVAGLYTHESGTQVTFTVVLDTKPTDNVVVDLTSSDLSEGSVSPTTLTFTADNWNTNQTVTVTGVDDVIDDSDIAYNIVTEPAVSADPNYNGFDADDVSLTNQDDDIAGIMVNPVSLTINENGIDQTFDIVLNTEPTDNVTIGISSANTNKATVSDASITFEPGNWNVPQTITVTPVDNDIDDGDVIFNIVTALATSNDDNYKNRNAADVEVTSIDNDVAGINVTSISGNTSERGTTATFSISLESEPTDDVTIGISSTNTSEGIVSDGSVTFTALNWNSPVEITVTGQDDLLADGNQTYNITLDAAVSSDLNYDGIDPDDIEVINADDDSPGVTVFPVTGLSTTEAGGTATFTIVLNSQPTNDVNIDLSSDDITEGSVLPVSTTFTDINWNSPQTITITGIDDTDNDGDFSYSIITGDAVSSDVVYDGLSVQNVSVTNLDDTTPRLVDDAGTTDEDTEINIDVLANDKGLDNGGLNLSITAQPSFGSVYIEADNSITYTPDGLFNGDDTFNYTVCDGQNDCDEATVTVTVTFEDDIPVAVGDERGTSINTAVAVDVLTNDFGLEDGGIILGITEQPNASEGSAAVDANNIVFTPETDFTGTSSFIYNITDNDGDTDTAVVTINVHAVNSVPDAVDDNVETQINTPVDITVLANDLDLDDGFGDLSIEQAPANGSVMVNANRTITYTPDVDFVGGDTFRYLLEDADGDYDIATVNITVTTIPDATPVANDDNRATNYNTAVIIDVLANDSGLEDGVQDVIISTEPINGTAVVNGDFTVTYTPDNGFSGTESFGYQISDTDGDNSNVGTVTITVLPEGENNEQVIALDDTAETVINTAVTVNVLSNDTLRDGFGDLVIHSAASFGSAVVNANRTITYTPGNEFIGSDSFSYWIEDIHGDYDIATVHITVTEVPNAQPQANDDSRATEYETSVSVDVLSNDTGLDDIPISLSVVQPLEGTATISGDHIDYVPSTGYSGVMTFTYTVTDSDGDSDDATVSITVLPEGETNEQVIALDDTAETLINTSVTVSVLSNDTLRDGFGDLMIHSDASFGSAVVNANRTITYTPGNEFIGSDSFSYWIEDIHGDYDIATVHITVTEVPDVQPQANDDSRATEYETSVSVDVLSNDTGLDDTPISFSVIQPLEGTATVNGDRIDYVPSTGYSGVVTFTYTVTDSDGDSDDATVTITVLPEGETNAQVIALDDTAETLINTPVTVSVLSNDTLRDGFGDLIIHNDASFGSAVVNANRTITYTPGNEFIGSDSFSYWIEDIHGDYDIATVHITVTDVPNAQPQANDDSRATEHETSISVDVLSNDTGLDDTPISLSVVQPLEGTATVHGDRIDYVPSTGYSGVMTFTYTVTDADGDSDDATVTITVLPEGETNAQVIALDDTAETLINTAVTVNVLSNDTLRDGFGDLIIHSDASFGSAVVNANRTITYTPGNEFIGSDSFSYWIEDIHGDYDIATVHITVTEVPNAQPQATDDSRATEYETSISVDVLANDTGLDDTTISLSVIQPLEGTATVNGDRIDYVPSTGYSGVMTFTYTVTDSDGDSDDATVTITVLPEGETNEQVIALDDTAETLINTAVTVNVLSNDTLRDGFGDLIIHSDASFGNAVVNANRTITYTPGNEFIGSDSFSYWIEDIHGDYDIATVHITVTEVPDVQPQANDDSRATEHETSISVDVLSNDTGLDDTPISLSVVQPTEGTATVSGDHIDYVPSTGYSGVMTFTYTVTDADGDSDDATVTITVLPEGETNEPVIALDDTAETLINTAVTVNVLSNDTLRDGFGDLIIHSDASFGSAVVNANRTITYTPGNEFIGSDSFSYWIEDIHGDYDIATVVINVLETPNYKPKAIDDSRGTEFNTPVTIDVLTNDSGLEDGGIVVIMESDPAEGSAIVNADNKVTYTPVNGFSGIMPMQYRVTDKDGDFSVANIFIIVKEDGMVNHIPVAVNDDVETYENISVDINVLANDTGLEDGFGDLIMFEYPDNGTVTMNANRTITYSPSNLFIGTDEFIYWVEDVDGDYDTARVTISVLKEGNAIPKAMDDARGTEYETSVSVDVLTNDAGLEDGGIIVTIESEPELGTISVNDDNTITYTPAGGFSGSEIFQYRVTDIDGDYDTAYVQINVKEEGETNYKPFALNDTSETFENVAVDINILDNDTGLEDGFGEIRIYESPVNGSVTVNTNRTITYKPANAYIGKDSLMYWLEDVDGDYAMAAVHITVESRPNYIPVANDDGRGTSINTDVIVDVLINDTGLEDGGIVVSSSTNPSNGIITVNGDNTITYSPDADYTGTDQFDYQVCDVDSDCSTATVTITVKESNVVPVAVDDALTAYLNTSATLDVLSNDNGLEDGGISVTIFTQPTHGTAVVNGDNSITYTPGNWYLGTDSLEYMVTDVDGDYSIAKVVITVTSEPDHQPVANDDARGTSMNTNVVVDVLVNDTGLEDGGIVVSNIADPTNGTITVNGDNTITYTPGADYTGTDQFGYQICDADGDCDEATVIITVREENNVPVAIDDKVFTNVDTDITVHVLENDSGLEDGGIGISISTGSSNGTLTVNDDNTITYSPNPSFEGIDTFSYMVTDVDGDYDIADVVVYVMSGTLPGITFSNISGNTKEDGTTATFTVVLKSQPTENVNIDMNSDDLTEGILSENRLTFTSSNWDIVQTITITGQDDDIDDGDVTYNLVSGLVSVDPIYSGIIVENMSLTNVDDDEAGIALMQGENETSENGDSARFMLVLNSEPLEDVNIEVSSNDLTEGMLEIMSIVFTSENWSDTVEVIVIGQDDDEVDGDISYTIEILASQSDDPNYHGIDLEYIALINIDNDSKELTIPEAFSPGNDGYNDFFEIVNLQHHDKASLRVYNRWGSLVYSSDQYQNNWDGKSNAGGKVGSELPTGTYYYVLEVSDMRKKISGYVFIKR